MSFHIHKGCVFFSPVEVPEDLLAQVDDGWKQRRETRDATQAFHITVVRPTEKDAVQAAEILLSTGERLEDSVGIEKSEHDGKVATPYYLLGVTVKNGVAFAPCIFPAAQRVREFLGLDPCADLHVTLGFQFSDKHDMDKSYRSLWQSSSLCGSEIERYLRECTPKNLDASVIQHLHEKVDRKNLTLHKAYVASCLRSKEDRITSLLEMVDNGHVANGLVALHRIGYDVIPMMLSQKSIECDSAAQTDVLCALFNEQRTGKYWATATSSAPGSGGNPADEQRRSLTIWRTPLNFSEVVPGLYASGCVQSKHAAFLNTISVSTIVNLMEETGTTLAQDNRFRFVHVPVVDREPPSSEQLDGILRELDPRNRNRGAAIVHCLGGRGRTAYVILAYLMTFQHLSLGDAFQVIASRDTLLTDSQRSSLRDLEATLISPPKPEVQEHDFSTNIKFDAIIMCGLPGSGKSTLSKHLATHCARIVRVSQDEMGRKEAYGQMSKAKASDIVLVDRCNPTPQDRTEWRPARAKKVLCIFVDTPPEEAIYRVVHRTGHETLQKGAAEKIVNMVASSFVPPNAAAENFTVMRLASETEVAHQVASWGLPSLTPPPLDTPFIVKFPRTRHIVNLGAAARDDLVLSDAMSFLNTPVYVEEKIDGANFGISIDPQTHELTTQNRGHYVTSNYHKQFSRLPEWLARNGDALHGLLVPGREILFGEWCVATHSIPYARLPGFFIAFDLYDKVTEEFLSRPKLEERLRDTGIPIVPLLAFRVFHTVAELSALVMTESAFYDGRVEGVYVRKCDETRTTDRGKIVRSDFICGNEHWSHSMFKRNTVLF